MPKVRLPLVGSYTTRGIDGQTVIAAGKDQRFLNVIFDLVVNPITKRATVWVERRPGWTTQSVVSAGNVSTGLIRTDSLGTVVSAFGATNSTIFDSTTNVGTITGLALHFSETILNSVGYILIKSSDGTGWYYAAGARDVTAYTGDTHTNTTVDGILPSTAGMYSGQLLAAAADIVAGTRILTVDSASAITLDTAATGTTNDLAITKTPIAKILDADFLTTGTTFSAFELMDGYPFYCNSDGFVYHGDINTITAYGAASKIAANASPDMPLAIAKQNEKILCFGNNSMEAFYNAGNASGSVLSRYGNPKRVGIQNQRSLAYLGDDIYFVTSSRDGDTQVKRMRGLQDQKISTPQVDRILGTMTASGANIYASAFNLGGYSYLSLIATTPSSAELLLQDGYKFLLQQTGNILLQEITTTFNRTLLYNIDLNIWFEWDGTLLTFLKGMGSGSLNQIIATSCLNTSGKIYQINPSADGEVYQDDGSTYSTVIQTSEVDHGTDAQKFTSKISLIADTQTAGTVTLECTDDGYANWTTLGTFDLTQESKEITRCGSYIKRAYRLTHAYNGPWRAFALDETFEVGTRA